MEEFKEVKASARSVSNRRAIYGVGINDSDFLTEIVTSGKRSQCPIYKRWHNMLRRCYSRSAKELNPTYKGCKVSDSWLVFSNFKAWMASQDWKGKELDKDLIVPGNKVYSSENCAFIPKSLNNLLNDSRSSKGSHPQGVHKHRSGKFAANISIDCKLTYLGLYATPEMASAAYLNKKSEVIFVASKEQDDIRVRNGLILVAESMAISAESAHSININ